MEDGNRAGETVIAQVRIEVVDMLGEEHTLVDEGPRRKRADVEVSDACGGNGFFDPLADQEKRTFDF